MPLEGNESDSNLSQEQPKKEKESKKQEAQLVKQDSEKNILAIISDNLEKVRSLVFSLIVIVFFFFICLFAIKEVRKEYILIEPFEVPESLVKDGYTGAVIAKQLLDEINYVKKYATDSAYYGTSIASTKLVTTTNNTNLNFEVPVAGISFNSLISFVRNYLDKDPKKISGEVLIDGDSLKINVRYDDLIRSVTASKNYINKSFNSVAVDIIKEFQPLVLINYYIAKKDYVTSEDIFNKINFKKNNIDSLDIKFFKGVFYYKHNKLAEAYESFYYVYSKNTSNLDALKNLSLVYSNQNKPEEAERMYRRILYLEPDDYYTRINLADVLIGQDNIPEQEIETVLNEAIEINPNLSDAYYSLGRLKYRNQELQKAEKLAKKAIEIDSSQQYYYVLLGDIMKSSERSQKAEILYRKAIEINENEMGPYIRLSDLFIETNKLNEAETITKIVIEKRPNYANAFYNLGTIYRKQKKYFEAKSMYSKACELAPLMLNAYAEVGSVLEKEQKFKEAENVYTDIVNKYPNNFQGYYRLGELYHGKKEYKIAESFYDTALGIVNKGSSSNSDKALLYESLAYSLYYQKKYTESKKACYNVISINKYADNIYHLLSNILYIQEQYNQAEVMIRSAIKYRPNAGYYYTDLGNILEAQNKNREAENAFRKAIAMDTSNTYSFSDLGMFLIKENKIDEAKSSFKKSLKFGKENINAYYALGSLLQNENPDEAESMYNKAISLGAKNSEIYEELAIIYIKKGKFKEAENILKKAMYIDPDLLNTYYQLGIVYFKMGDFNKSRRYFQYSIKRDSLYTRNILNLDYFYRTNIIIHSTYSPVQTFSYDNAEAYYCWASLLERNNNVKTAKNYYKMSIVTNSNYYPSYTNLANLLERERNLKMAEEIYSFCIEYKPEITINYFKRANILLEQERYFEAKRLFLSYLSKKNNDKDLLEKAKNNVSLINTIISRFPSDTLQNILKF